MATTGIMVSGRVVPAVASMPPTARRPGSIAQRLSPRVGEVEGRAEYHGPGDDQRYKGPYGSAFTMLLPVEAPRTPVVVASTIFESGAFGAPRLSSTAFRRFVSGPRSEPLALRAAQRGQDGPKKAPNRPRGHRDAPLRARFSSPLPTARSSR